MIPKKSEQEVVAIRVREIMSGICREHVLDAVYTWLVKSLAKDLNPKEALKILGVAVEQTVENSIFAIRELRSMFMGPPHVEKIFVTRLERYRCLLEGIVKRRLELLVFEWRRYTTERVDFMMELMAFVENGGSPDLREVMARLPKKPPPMTDTDSLLDQYTPEEKRLHGLISDAMILYPPSTP